MKSLQYLTLAFAAAAIAPALASGSGPVQYHDYPRMLEAVTAKMREAIAKNPEATADSMRHHLLETLQDGPVGPAKALTPARTKKLDATKVYDLCRKSALVFGKMDYVEYVKADSAYSNASAVALTADGIVATNYHVVSDIVLDGAAGQDVQGDRARFVMDCEGDVFPVRSILAVDPVNDMALIKVDTSAKRLVPAAVSGDLPPGSTVYCLSNPTGAYFHFTEGQVSNNTGVLDKRTGFNKYVMEITADYGVGASGGPIFDSCGNLVALVSSTVSVYAQPQQYRNFQMAYKQTVPVFIIKDKFTN